MGQLIYATGIYLIRVTFIDAKFEFTKDGLPYSVDYQPSETTAGHDLLRTEDTICLKSRDFFYFQGRSFKWIRV